MAMRDILKDRDFWREQRADTIEAVRPLFRDWFISGAIAGMREIQRMQKADVEDLGAFALTIEEAVDTYLDGYINAWWDGIEATRRKALRDAIADAAKLGKGWQYVAKRISHLFSPARAKMIAVTELTNAMGAGAQAVYKANGYQSWQWRTVRDNRVDPICESRTDVVYPMDEPFQAAHPRCRCWAVPFGLPAMIPDEGVQAA